MPSGQKWKWGEGRAYIISPWKKSPIYRSWPDLNSNNHSSFQEGGGKSAARLRPQQTHLLQLQLRPCRIGANPETLDLVTFRGSCWITFSELSIFLGKVSNMLCDPSDHSHPGPKKKGLKRVISGVSKTVPENTPKKLKNTVNTYFSTFSDIFRDIFETQKRLFLRLFGDLGPGGPRDSCAPKSPSLVLRRANSSGSARCKQFRSTNRLGSPIELPDFPEKSIREGASNLFGRGPESPKIVSCSRATPRLHRCKSGLL